MEQIPVYALPLRIVLDQLQIMCSFTATMDVDWPPAFYGFIRAFSWLNLARQLPPGPHHARRGCPPRWSVMARMWWAGNEPDRCTPGYPPQGMPAVPLMSCLGPGSRARPSAPQLCCCKPARNLRTGLLRIFARVCAESSDEPASNLRTSLLRIFARACSGSSHEPSPNLCTGLRRIVVRACAESS